jgi:hypothetical protein
MKLFNKFALAGKRTQDLFIVSFYCLVSQSVPLNLPKTIPKHSRRSKGPYFTKTPLLQNEKT